MGRSIKFLFILFVLCGLPASLLTGAEIRVGQVGFRFLENPVSAEAIGRGGLGMVMLRNSNTVYWNPAGLGWLESKVDMNANYTKGIADIDRHSFVGAYRYRNITLALDYFSVDYGVLSGTRRANTPEGFVETGEFFPQASVFGISLGQKVSHRFSYGIRLKSAYQNLGDAYVAPTGTDVDDEGFDGLIKPKTYDLRVAILDVGAIYDFQLHGIRFGAAINNISKEVKYVDNSFPLPFSVNFALSVNPLSFLPVDMNARSLNLGIEVSRPRDFDERVRVGAEYNYHDLLIARVGYMGNYDERGITLGGGFRKKITNYEMRVDYAYQDFGIFNGTHTFSIGFSH